MTTFYNAKDFRHSNWTREAVIFLAERQVRKPVIVEIFGNTQEVTDGIVDSIVKHHEINLYKQKGRRRAIRAFTSFVHQLHVSTFLSWFERCRANGPEKTLAMIFIYAYRFYEADTLPRPQAKIGCEEAWEIVKAFVDTPTGPSDNDLMLQNCPQNHTFAFFPKYAPGHNCPFCTLRHDNSLLNVVSSQRRSRQQDNQPVYNCV